MSLQVDLSAKRTKSLQLLQRMNETVFEIIHDATQSAVYNFNLKTSGWEKAGIEGALFVTRNSVAPYYSVFVLNKLAPENFSLNLDTVINVSCQSPFIMLRYATQGAPAIAGLWFHDDTSRNEMMEAINVARERIKGIPSALPTTSSPSKTNKLKELITKTPSKTASSSSQGDGSKTNMLKGLLGKAGGSSSKVNAQAAPSLASPADAHASAPAVAAPTNTVFSMSASQKLLGAIKGGGGGGASSLVTGAAAGVPPSKNEASKKLLGMLKKGPGPIESSREEKQREVVKEELEEEKKVVPVQEQPKKSQAFMSPSDLL